MAARMNAEDQFKFLLSCVKWSVNGKVDFAEVAAECNVVSKGAAAKRYERMLKTHGINPQGGPLDSPSLSRERNMAAAPKSFKKRKVDNLSGLTKQHDEEDKKPQHPKRPRSELHHHRDPNRDFPMMGYPPPHYAGYHPMMSQHNGFMSRPFSGPGMHTGMPYGPPPQMHNHAHQSSAPHMMFPGPVNNHQFLMQPQNHIQPFNMNKIVPALTQDNKAAANVGDVSSHDFVEGGFEAFLYADPVMPQNLDEENKPDPVFEQPSQPPISAQLPQVSVPMTPNLKEHIKPEPAHAVSPALIDPKLLNEPAPYITTPLVPTRAQDDTNSHIVSTVTAKTNATEILASSGLEQPDHSMNHEEEETALKQELDEGCILISD